MVKINATAKNNNSAAIKQTEAEIIRLKAEKEAAELANKVKTEFLQNMRHDLRTSLSGIQGFSELLRGEIIRSQFTSYPNSDIAAINAAERRAKKIEYIDNLVASCRALTHIHNQILHAIQVFSGDVPTYRYKFSLENKLKQIVDLHLAKANEKSLEFKVNYDKRIPKYLVGDSRRFTAIALELVSNALKYTHSGKVVVSAVLESQQKRKDKHGNRKVVIKFVVQDTGIGISDDKKTEIFTRFGRLTPSYEGKYVGLGLGLSVVKQFIDDLAGEIYVDSVLNKGTTFTCYLPFMQSLSSDAKNVANDFELPLPNMEIGSENIRPILQRVGAIRGRNKKIAGLVNVVPTILQVEDEEVCVLITQSILVKLGFKVDVARNGEEALQKCKDRHYDLIIMDVGLPDISGIEVTRKIRVVEKSTNQYTPIIALTAHIDTESKQQCIESGMDAVLSKPIATEKFVEVLKAFIPSCSIREVEKEKMKKTKTIKKSKADENEKVLLELDGAVLDFDYMKKNFWYGKEETKELLQKIALPSLEREVKLLQGASVEHDWDTVQRIAHKLSGACSSAGLMRLWAICKRLELYLMGKNSKITDELIDVLIVEYKAARKVIKAL